MSKTIPDAMLIGAMAHVMLSGDNDFLSHHPDERRFAVLAGGNYQAVGADVHALLTSHPEVASVLGPMACGKTTSIQDFEAHSFGQSGGQIAEIMYAQPDRTGTLPDRVSIERRHEFYDPIVDQLGVRIDGIEQDSVVEYCRSERWARIGERGHDGKLIWDFDHYKSRRVEDVEIEPYWRKPLNRQQRRAREAKMPKTKR